MSRIGAYSKEIANTDTHTDTHRHTHTQTHTDTHTQTHTYKRSQSKKLNPLLVPAFEEIVGAGSGSRKADFALPCWQRGPEAGHCHAAKCFSSKPGPAHLVGRRKHPITGRKHQSVPWYVVVVLSLFSAHQPTSYSLVHRPLSPSCSFFYFCFVFVLPRAAPGCWISWNTKRGLTLSCASDLAHMLVSCSDID